MLFLFVLGAIFISWSLLAHVLTHHQFRPLGKSTFLTLLGLAFIVGGFCIRHPNPQHAFWINETTVEGYHLMLPWEDVIEYRPHSTCSQFTFWNTSYDGHAYEIEVIASWKVKPQELTLSSPTEVDLEKAIHLIIKAEISTQLQEKSGGQLLGPLPNIMLDLHLPISIDHLHLKVVQWDPKSKPMVLKWQAQIQQQHDLEHAQKIQTLEAKIAHRKLKEDLITAQYENQIRAQLHLTPNILEFYRIQKWDGTGGFPVTRFK